MNITSKPALTKKSELFATIREGFIRPCRAGAARCQNPEPENVAPEEFPPAGQDQNDSEEGRGEENRLFQRGWCFSDSAYSRCERAFDHALTEAGKNPENIVLS